MKVEVSVISRSRRLRLVTLTDRISQKRNLIYNCLLHAAARNSVLRFTNDRMESVFSGNVLQ